MIIDILREYTLPGLSSICNIPSLTFKGWIERKTYKIESPVENKSFSMTVYSHEELLLPFAYDINRMAASSFESISGIKPEKNLPKSIGWLIIRAYYSAFFAAHAILRLFGISCSQFDNNEVRSISEVANIYEMMNGRKISSGYYLCEYDFREEVIKCIQLSNTHQDVWRKFFVFLENIAKKIPSADFLEKDKLEVISYIYSLRDGLSFKGTVDGNWLSTVRNKVNYAHAMGAWYPYHDSSNEHELMFRIIKKWNSRASNDLLEMNKYKCDHLYFTSTCVSIVSLCYSLVTDFCKINPNSFLTHTPFRLLNQISMR